MATSKPSHLQDKHSGLPQGRRTPTSRSSPGKPVTNHLKSSTTLSKNHHPSPCTASSSSSSTKQRSIPSRKPLENPASPSRQLHKSPTPPSTTKERASKTAQPSLPKHSTTPSKTLRSAGRGAVPYTRSKSTVIAATSNTLKRKTSIESETSSPAAAGETETRIEPATDVPVVLHDDTAATVTPELEEDHENTNLIRQTPPVPEELEEQLVSVSEPEQEQQEEMTNLESGSEIAGEEEEEEEEEDVEVHGDDDDGGGVGDGGKETQALREQKSKTIEAAMPEGESSQSGRVVEKKIENVEVKRAEKQGRREAPPAGNTVIEETASKLAEKRKNRVLALVGAFETVISLQEHEGGAQLADKNSTGA